MKRPDAPAAVTERPVVQSATVRAQEEEEEDGALFLRGMRTQKTREAGLQIQARMRACKTQRMRAALAAGLPAALVAMLILDACRGDQIDVQLAIADPVGESVRFALWGSDGRLPGVDNAQVLLAEHEVDIVVEPDQPRPQLPPPPALPRDQIDVRLDIVEPDEDGDIDRLALWQSGERLPGVDNAQVRLAEREIELVVEIDRPPTPDYRWQTVEARLRLTSSNPEVCAFVFASELEVSLPVYMMMAGPLSAGVDEVVAVENVSVHDALFTRIETRARWSLVIDGAAAGAENLLMLMKAEEEVAASSNGVWTDALAFFFAGLEMMTATVAQSPALQGVRWGGAPTLTVIQRPSVDEDNTNGTAWPAFPYEPEDQNLTDDVCLLAPNKTAHQSFCVFDARDEAGVCACIPGFASPPDDLLGRCVPCPGGTFKPSYDSAQGCMPCPPGLATPPGSIAQTACRPCRANHTPSATGVCEACGTHMVSMPGDSACGCVPGAAFDVLGTRCILCAAGLYQPVYAAAVTKRCQLCPALYTTRSLEQGATACSACLPGAFSSASKTCVACAAGTFSSDLDASSCTACASGSYLAYDAGTVCAACPDGTVQPKAGQSACMSCGSTMVPEEPARTACVCMPGTASDLMGTRCVPCYEGYFKPEAGNGTGCSMCPYPLTAAQSGASACTDCLPGTFRDAPENACVFCPPGRFQPDMNGDGASACAPCPAGSYGPFYGLSVCWPCPADTISGDGASACTPCPSHSDTRGADGSTRCDCVEGWAFNDQAQACTACPPGAIQAYRNQGECAFCRAGTYAGDIGEGLTCVRCPAGTFAPIQGWTACLACPEYMVSASGAVACTCAPGATQDLTTLTCLPCPVGAFFAPNTPCQPCPPGTYSTTLMSTACAPCPDHTETPLAGSSACIPCLAMVTADRSDCQCPPRRFNASLASLSPAELLWLNATFFDGNVSGEEAFNANFPDPANRDWLCKPCLDDCGEGRYIAAECTHDADALCANCSADDSCPAGTFLLRGCTPSADRVCWPCRDGCVQGYFVSRPCSVYEDTRCAPCTGGCPVGFHVVASCRYDADTVCRPCDPGSYSLGGMVWECTRCAPGFAALGANATGCAPCHGYSSVLRDACVDACPPGAYPSAVDACSACPPHTYSPDGLSCVACLGCVSADGARCDARCVPPQGHAPTCVAKK